MFDKVVFLDIICIYDGDFEFIIDGGFIVSGISGGWCNFFGNVLGCYYGWI